MPSNNCAAVLCLAALPKWRSRSSPFRFSMSSSRLFDWPGIVMSSIVRAIRADTRKQDHGEAVCVSSLPGAWLAIVKMEK